MKNKEIILLAVFVLIWMIPLFFPVASLIRYAFEELRVLVTGIMIGYLIVRREGKE